MGDGPPARRSPDLRYRSPRTHPFRLEPLFLRTPLSPALLTGLTDTANTRPPRGILPKSAQPVAKKAIQGNYNAEDKEHAAKAVKVFGEQYGTTVPKAAKKIADDDEAELLPCYGFPAEHWIRLRTTNPIWVWYFLDGIGVGRRRRHGARCGWRGSRSRSAPPRPGARRGPARWPGAGSSRRGTPRASGRSAARRSQRGWRR
ncbi:hypothetical protein GR130_20275 [Streptomyces sp. GS7]|nr:hypothetical protein GR130_20275 [Streptomyces sp. GS7]